MGDPGGTLEWALVRREKMEPDMASSGANWNCAAIAHRSTPLRRWTRAWRKMGGRSPGLDWVGLVGVVRQLCLQLAYEDACSFAVVVSVARLASLTGKT